MHIKHICFLYSCLLPMALTSCNDAPVVPAVQAATSSTKSASAPVVVELFQSQGCSSCPPADIALNAEADRGDVIALNFAVTYWDRLGWKDIYGDPAYTQRQYAYAAALKDTQVYTPQVVINGRRVIVGNGPGEIRRAIAAANGVSGGPVISSGGSGITIGAGVGAATIWLVRYDPRIQNVAIKAGENKGRTIPHRNVVRQLIKLGSWNGKVVNYTLPKSPSAVYKNAVLVQRTGGGAIYSAKIV
jgi:hypothetical protein